MVTWPLLKRQQHLMELSTKGAVDGTHTETFQGRVQNFPCFRVPIELPCFRLKNGRTRDVQAEYISINKLRPDFFDVDPDSEPALKIQEDVILRGMVKDKGLLDLMASEEQTEPLILDENGYVVNGNRRLCAMRMLLAQEKDSEKYKRFKYVRIMILPKCTDLEIKELEAKLQVHRDVKAEYTWTALAIMLRDLRASGMSDVAIGDLYDKKDSEIRQLIRMLDQAEDYLATRGLNGQYSKVAKTGEFAFKQLTKYRNSCGREPERDVFTSLSYLLIDDPSGGRLYERIPDLQKNLVSVNARLVDELQISKGGAAEKGEGKAEDVFGGSAGAEEDTYKDVMLALVDQEKRDKARAIVQDTLEEIDRRERERRDAEYCLRLVSRAHTDLQSTVNALEEGITRAGMDQHLDNIETLVKRIREWLREHHSS